MNPGDKTYQVHGKNYVMPKRDYHYFLFNGLLSGYSRCCIEAFMQRRLIRIFKNGKDQDAPRFLEMWLELKAEVRKDIFLQRFQHVLCSECYARYRAEDFMPQYFYCENCHWTQFQKQECNLCGSLGCVSPATPNSTLQTANFR